MQLISKFDKEFRFLLGVVYIFSKYSWVMPSKDKKENTITNVFQRILDELNHKPKKIWTNKGSEVYDRPMKLLLHNYDIEMYPTHNEGKPVVAERSIRHLKDNIYRYITSISKKCLY